MIVDEIKITVTAGNGGRGLVTFSRVKFAEGPTGGNGGKGGDIFIEGIADLGALRKFRFKKDYKAENGENGKSGLHDGRNAKDLILFVPVGAVCHNLTGQPKGQFEDIEITKIGQRKLIAKGGKGGKGNWFFRSATNTSPRQFQEGKPGEYFEIRLELKMIADVGFIGLPNVGKSSLLNELTKAEAKVANYPFTTLEPNLGAYYDLILADIPGLIEGASTGKGLGIKFLRHIERTKVLFHFISADSADPIKDYENIRTELKAYNKLLLEKPEYIFISKSDTVDTDVISRIKDDFKKIYPRAKRGTGVEEDNDKKNPRYGVGVNKEIIVISIIEPDSIESVKKILNNLISEKKA